MVKRHASDLTGAHAYVCGPPPMVEAALPLLAQLGVEEKRIYYDKFTTTGEPEHEDRCPEPLASPAGSEASG